MSASIIYNLIDECMTIYPSCCNVSLMCALGGVSRSGYYAWKNAASKRQKGEAKDKEDFALILSAYEYRGSLFMMKLRC